MDVDEEEYVAPDAIRDNPHYKINGLDGEAVEFRRKLPGITRLIAPSKITHIDELLVLAPQLFWTTLGNTDILNTQLARTVGDQLMRIAEGIGQIDHSKKVERGAVRLPEGKVAYHLGDRVLIGGAEIGLNDNTDRVWLAGPPLDLGSPARLDRVKDIARAVLDYRWASQDDGRRFLGWIVAAMVGGALEWRPHLWLTAPAGTGKTWLFDNVLLKLMGPALVSLADATPASVARLTGNSSLPIGIDEAEPNHEWVMNLLPTLRVAASGVGERVRADAHGGVNRQSPRFSAILSSTIAPNLPKADATRITEVGLATESVEDWPAVRRAIQNAMKHADGARYKMFREAQVIVHEADRLAGEMQDLGMDSREAMASAALTAGWRWWGVDDREVMAQPETSERTDASDALLEILALRYHAPGGASYSVAHMLTDTTYETALLDLFGIRRVGHELWIAEKHHGLQAAMARSKWASADLRKLLKQMDGVTATPNATRFGALRTRAIVIPPETLAAAGVDLGELKQGDDV